MHDEHVAVMTLEERGAYITLLCTCWTECSVPSDTKRLSRLFGATTKKTKTLWDALSPRFSQPDEHGRCTHPRLEKERQKQAMYRERASSGGIAKSQKQAALKQPSSSPQAVLNRCTTDRSLQSSSSSSHTDPDEARVGNFYQWWEWTAYPEHRGVRYCSTPNCFDHAKFLVAHYDDSALLKQIAEVFLQIPDEAEPWLRGKTRTLGMLRSKASAIEERLKGKAV